LKAAHFWEQDSLSLLGAGILSALSPQRTGTMENSSFRGEFQLVR